jgi:hypothetical protein
MTARRDRFLNGGEHIPQSPRMACGRQNYICYATMHARRSPLWMEANYLCL